ncbi:MAG: GRP family sugar transporter [Candidatus Altiarchaeota archaeon]
MEDWLALGLAAAFSYSISGLMAKVVLDKRYLGLDGPTAALLVMVGVIVGFTSFYLILAGPKIPQLTVTNAAAGIAVGFFWALGSILVYYGLIKGADVSRMAPIYNMNTLLVVLGGIILLKELPDRTAMARVMVGAVLIVVGGILVSG